MAAVNAQALGRAAATRSSQQRGSAGWLQSTTTRVTLSAGGIAPPLLHGALRLQMLGPTQSRDPVSSIGGQPHQPREEQAHCRI